MNVLNVLKYGKKNMLKRIKYWLELNTMNPLAWPYVLIYSIKYRLFSPKRVEAGLLTLRDDDLCPVCGHQLSLTEQGLCENCGNIVL